MLDVDAWRMLPGRLALLVCLFTASFSLPAAAQDVATVRLDGRALFAVASSDDVTASVRAHRTERRLERLLDRRERIGAVRVLPGSSPDERMLGVDGVALVTVTAADAEEHLVGIDALAQRWASDLERALARAHAERRSPWRRFATEVKAAAQGAFGSLLETALTALPRVLAASLTLLLFGALAAGLRRALRFILRHVIEDLTIENLLKQVVFYVVWGVGLVLAFGALGLDPETTLAGLGLTGLALGFALKDILSNWISGLLLLTLRPFRIDDQIVVGDTEGAVERITLRATEIRTHGGRLVLVPNSEVFTSRVTNNTASPVRRGSVSVYLGYDEDLRRAASVLERAARSAEGVEPEPPPSVRVGDLERDDVQLVVRFWADSRRTDFVATSSAVREAAVFALREAKFALPNPDRREVYVHQADGEPSGDDPRKPRHDGASDAPA